MKVDESNISGENIVSPRQQSFKTYGMGLLLWGLSTFLHHLPTLLAGGLLLVAAPPVSRGFKTLPLQHKVLWDMSNYRSKQDN